MNFFLCLAYLFFIGSTFGWVLELFFRKFFSGTNPEHKWINPGFCVGPYVPLYGFGLCILFLLDFILEWFLAKHKGRYFATHFVFLLVAIPYQSIISWAGWTFSEEITYLLRFIPLVRGGYALAIVVGWLTYNKASGLFVTYLTTLLATVYFSSLAFYVMEHGVNTLVTGYGDALWWAFMDVTTVGSNIIAVTVTGRVLSVLLAALGMMMFPIFTVYVTSLVQKRNQEKQEYYKELQGGDIK